MWYDPPKQLLKTDLVEPSTAAAGDRRDFPLLAVAHGLSYERMQWPTWFPPSETDPLPESGVVEKEFLPHHYDED